MKKILSIIFICVMVILSLAACGKDNPQPANTVTESFKETPGTTKAETLSVNECMSAYETYLNKYVNENTDSIDSDGVFSLVYIDNDDIPELVIGAQHFHAAGAELCIYNGSSVKNLGNYGQFGQMVYFPKKNVFFNHYSSMGGANTTVYNLENCAGKEIQNFKEEPLDIASEEFRYYVDDKEVSREEYEKSYSQVVPENPIITPDLESSDSYPLTEDGIRQCFSFSAESTTYSGKESYTDKESNFNPQEKSLAYLAGIGYANKAVEMLGENYMIDYFYKGIYSRNTTGNFAEQRMVYYPYTDEYGTIGLIIYRFGDKDGEKVTDDDIVNGVMHNGEDTVVIDNGLNSNITYGELKDRFGVTAEEDSDTGIFIATIEYRGNDIHFAFNESPSDSDIAFECWLQPHI